MINLSERELWRVNRESIWKITQDAPAWEFTDSGPSWLFRSKTAEAWFNMGYISSKRALTVFSDQLNADKVPGIFFFDSQFKNPYLNSLTHLFDSPLQLHRFGTDSEQNWDTRIPGVSIERVRDLSQLQQSNQIQSGTFEFDINVLNQVVGNKVISDPDVSIYNLIHQGKPVSTVTLSQTNYKNNRLVEVWSMATLPDEQQKGFGKHLLGQLLTDCKSSGIAGAVLTASEEGRPLYDRLGFTTVATNSVWRLDNVASNGLQTASTGVS